MDHVGGWRVEMSDASMLYNGISIGEHAWADIDDMYVPCLPSAPLLSQIKAKMVAEAERDRELYGQRAALAEEGQELAREDRKLLQVS